MTSLEIAGVFFIVITIMRWLAWGLIRFGHWMQDGRMQTYTFYIRTSYLPEDIVKTLHSKGHYVIGHEETSDSTKGRNDHRKRG